MMARAALYGGHSNHHHDAHTRGPLPLPRTDASLCARPLHARAARARVLQTCAAGRRARPHPGGLQERRLRAAPGGDPRGAAHHAQHGPQLRPGRRAHGRAQRDRRVLQPRRPDRLPLDRRAVPPGRGAVHAGHALRSVYAERRPPPVGRTSASVANWSRPRACSPRFICVTSPRTPTAGTRPRSTRARPRAKASSSATRAAARSARSAPIGPASAGRSCRRWSTPTTRAGGCWRGS